MQVIPETQVPVPVQPIPPHWEYFARVPPVAGGAVVGLVAAREVEVAGVVPARVEVTTGVVGGLGLLAPPPV